MDQPQSITTGLEISGQTPDIESANAAEVRRNPIINMVRLCWVKRRMMAGIMAAGTLLSILIAYCLPVIYTSTATLMPPGSDPSGSSLIGLLAASGPLYSAASEMLAEKSPGAVFIGVLQSRTVREGLVRRFDLVHHYKRKLVEEACKELGDNTDVSENLKTGVISISVKADSAELAAKIAQGYVEELNRVVSRNSNSSARSERVFLEARLHEVKQDLDQSSKALSEFSTKSRTIDMPTQAKEMVDAGLRLQGELVAARTDLAALQQAYSEDNVRVRAARARVAELQSQLDEINGSSRKDTSRADSSLLGYPAVGELPALGLTYSDLARKIRVEETEWEMLTNEYELAKVEEAKEIPAVSVLDEANVPQRKSSPLRRVIVVLGTMLSFVAACILVIISSVWEKMDAQDERKKLATEIFNTTLKSLRWFWKLPGMSWIHTRFKGTEQPQ